ncbi:PepSY-associated TM helix domain-containing protein [Catenuloplanes atrovinosus]|uniref:Iron-regulated membrane protein n=1 Tax=Catenuloplanes atrovinosus TaxID=137266 RepID=A0AAE4CB69_9ACTN|nr:PepSY domain-containing protein [Catenuloplanes atrovinosus]MDR7276539.1 putative iron-regulated membrane protein [Catenuloplanes atrovinosus]
MTPPERAGTAVDVEITRAPARPGTWAALRPLVHRLHFYAGVLIGPFLLVAALSGGLYALSPQVEKAVYADLLEGGPVAIPLVQQVVVAQRATEVQGLVAVRPAPEGGTTRVIFDDGSFPESYRHAVFIDPADGRVLGQATVYGTSGALPVRSWIDELHRSLHLGDAGRLYSELAASWLWVVALGGLALRLGRARRGPFVPRRPRGRARTRGWHAFLGVWLLAGLLALSATGLTWSQYAGGNVTALRAQLGWSTPSLDTALGPAAAPSTGDSHAGHGGQVTPPPGAADPTQIDAILGAARLADIDSDQVEIGVPTGESRAWTVTEVDRAYPTSVDAAAVDPATLAVTDTVRFADYPFMAKLARWGVDLHMGALFGLPHQLALALLAAGLTTLVVLGYRMWWQRRPTSVSRRRPGPLLPPAGLRSLPWPALLALAAVTLAAGWFLPLLGLSLAAFLLLDVTLGTLHRRRRPTT